MIKYKTVELKTLIPIEYIRHSPELEQSIKKLGMITPLVICNGFVSDGHKRLSVALKNRTEALNVIELDNNPSEIYAALNSLRGINVLELAAVINNPDTDSYGFLKQLMVNPSPSLHRALEYIGKHMDALMSYSTCLPINIWRDLGALEKDIEKFAIFLHEIKGTVSQKRKVAQMLKLIYKRDKLNWVVLTNDIDSLCNQLEKLAYPRKTRTKQQFEKALNNNPLPHYANVTVDNNFEKPGFNLAFPVQRHQLDRFDELKNSVKSLFESVNEL